jgi:hypothetical protein
MKHEALTPPGHEDPLDLPGIMERVAAVSARPRYTMLVLGLINRAAGAKGRAGPWIREGEALTPVREWLCDAITPMAARNHKRVALVAQVRGALEAASLLPADPQAAERLIEREVRERVRVSGLTGVSRAVTELVRAGLVTRHYQGYRVDHENRGAQRQAVYTVPPAVRAALGTTATLL